MMFATQLRSEPVQSCTASCDPTVMAALNVACLRFHCNSTAVLTCSCPLVLALARLSVTLKEADYQQLFLKEPSFPHTHFGMAADQPRLSAFSSALKAAITRAAAAKRQAQQAQQSAHAPGREGCVGGAAAAGSSDAASGEDAEHASPVEVVVLDLGCGSGVLSLLAASAAATTSLPMAAEGTNSAQGGAAAAAAAAPRPATTEPSVPGHVPTAPSVPVKASVIGVELVAPLAAAAIRNAALNGCSADISIVHGDAAMLERGNQVPVEGVDVVVFDMFDAGESLTSTNLLVADCTDRGLG